MQRVGVLVGRPAAWTALCSRLSDAGYHIVVTRPDPDPLDALLEEHDPDVLVLELGVGLYPLHLVRTRLRGRLEAKPLLVVALARPEHLTPPELVGSVDEFVLPPYIPEEVVARLHLALWRAKRIDAQHVVRCGGLAINLAYHEVRVEGRLVALSEREYALLTFLASHHGRSFSREALLRHVWGLGFGGADRVVDQCISRLRSALGTPYGSAIQTVRGRGYRLSPVAMPSSTWAEDGRAATAHRMKARAGQV